MGRNQEEFQFKSRNWIEYDPEVSFSNTAFGGKKILLLLPL